MDVNSPFFDLDLGAISLPNMASNNIGTRENGIPAQEAVAQIMNHILQVSGTAAQKSGFYQGLSSDTLKELGIGQLEQIKGQISDEMDKLKDSFSGLKSIFE